MTTPDNTGKVFVRQDLDGPGGTAVTLNYPRHQAAELRQIAASLVLKRTRRASLSLLARRSMGLYLELLKSGPVQLERERQALERMVTFVPCPLKNARNA